MQTDPFLDGMDDPYGDGPDDTDEPSPTMEQGLLFDVPSPRQEPKPQPVSRQEAKPIAQAEQLEPRDIPPPYRPKHIPYRDFLTVFNGSSSLALYWFNKQAIKE